MMRFRSASGVENPVGCSSAFNPWPHLRQKLADSGSSVWHFGHFILMPHGWVQREAVLHGPVNSHSLSSKDMRLRLDAENVITGDKMPE